MTLVELVCVTAIIAVLAGIAFPVANTIVKKNKELELRRALREIRTAIDQFQAFVEAYPQIRQTKLNAVNQEGYPEKLEWLYEGFDTGLSASTKNSKVKFMRRLPVDPMTGKRDWGTRSSRDEPGSHFSDGINIFDVHSKSEAVALDGTKYADW